MLEKFSARDRRFLLLCLAAFAVCAAVGALNFSRAFPEAALELRVGRDEARRRAGEILRREAGAPAEVFRGEAGWHHASRFAVDETPKIYLERTLGLEKANRLYGTDASVWRWDIRWFRSGQKEEWRASMTPLGRLVAFDHLKLESAQGERLSRAEAQARAREVLRQRGLDPAALDLVESTPRSLPSRTDWTLVFERRGFSMGEATVRYRVSLLGTETGGFQEFVKVPEQWQRAYARLRSANLTTGQVDSLALLLTILALLAVLIQKSVRRDVPWRLVSGFAVAGFVLALLAELNSFSAAAFQYETASSYGNFIVERVAFAILGAVAQAVLIALIVAGAEPIFRERCPEKLSVSAVFSRRGLRSRSCLRGIVLGYTLTAFFIAYQAVFYRIAAKLGAWAPAEVPYDEMLNSALPWATVLFAGFFPAVSEEFISRVFSIPFAQRLFRSRVLGLIVPAAIWGFGHAAYPNQPFFIRGVEVGIAGILVGIVFLRYGIIPILVWHFTVDAAYTAFLLLRSGNPYYVLSGVLSAGALLIPLIACVVAYRRRGGFEPEEGMTNGAAGFVPPPPKKPASPVALVVESPLPRRRAVTAAAIAAGLLVLTAVPARPPGQSFEDRLGRVRALSIAKSFLTANGVDPSQYHTAVYVATGFSSDRELREARPEESGQFAGLSEDAARYVLSRGGTEAFERLAKDELPVLLWAVRFVRPGEKGEWKLLIDAEKGRIAAFAHPIDEGDAGSPPPAEAQARERALRAAVRLGYPAQRYAVVETGAEKRPRRIDTRVTLEAGSAAVSDAKPRLKAVFHGGRLEAFYPELRVPEAYLRERASTGAAEIAIIFARIVSAALLVAAALWVLIAEVRREQFRWRRLLVPTLLFAFFSALWAVNNAPRFWRLYRTEIPLALFQTNFGVGILVQFLGVTLVAGVAFLWLSAFSPAWPSAVAFGRPWLSAIGRALAAAAGFAGIAHLRAIAATRWPAAFGAEVGLPASLDLFSPAFDTAFSAALRLLLYASGAAAATLAARSPRFSAPKFRLAAAFLLLLLTIPSGAKTPAEFILPWLCAAALSAWIVFAFLFVLRDSVRAWLVFGVVGLLGTDAAELFGQAAPADRLQGVLALLLGAAALLALVGARRNQDSPPRMDAS